MNDLSRRHQQQDMSRATNLPVNDDDDPLNVGYEETGYADYARSLSTYSASSSSSSMPMPMSMASYSRQHSCKGSTGPDEMSDSSNNTIICNPEQQCPSRASTSTSSSVIIINNNSDGRRRETRDYERRADDDDDDDDDDNDEQAILLLESGDGSFIDSSEELSSDWDDDQVLLDDDNDDDDEDQEDEEEQLVHDENRPAAELVGVVAAEVESRRQSSGWRTARKIVYLTPFFQTYKKNRYPWVQLAGHQGNFKSGEEQGTILKKLCGEEERCLRLLSQEDALRPFVPEYKGRLVGDDGQVYLVLQDLLAEFSNPCVMDCKMGLRTYLEEELAKAREKPKLRKDMYEKMCQIDPDAPSKEEHDVKAVTKPRYMVWRETISSTATLGFRIDGIKKADGELSKDFKTTRSRPQVREAIESFVRGFPAALRDHQQKLRDIKTALTGSRFFAGHEVIGSSLLFVHDSNKSGIWLIDFAKTFPIPPGTKTTHCDPWVVGNHEDGYLIGLNNLVDIFTEMCDDVDHATSSSSIVVDAARDNS